MAYPTASLQGLPAELCNEIYALAFTNYDAKGKKVVITRASFKRYAKAYVNACMVSRKLSLDVPPVFYGAHPFHFLAVETDFPTYKRHDPETTIQYGLHQKWKSLSKQQFHIRLPPLQARKSIQDISLRLLPPGADREIDPSWAWNHVIYSDIASDYLWPLRNLSTIGFTGLRSLKVTFVIKLYEHGSDGGQLWDHGFKIAVDYAIRRMGLQIKPIIDYEAVKADIYDFPPSPPMPCSWIGDESSTEASGSEGKDDIEGTSSGPDENE